MPTIRTYPKYESLATLRQSLAEQVPDMLNGFIITTNFGNINIDPEFAEVFRNLAADVLQYQLNQHTANNLRLEITPHAEVTQ